MPNHKIAKIEDYQHTYKTSIEDPGSFWNEIANTFKWSKKWTKTSDWNFHKAQNKWFIEGKLNITDNIFRHQFNKLAIIWEPNDPNEMNRYLTYGELFTEVNKFANVLKVKGVKKGDRVCIYLPMIPELVISMLACAKLGAIHSVVFAGFSSNSLIDRINDASCSLLITADGLYRGEKTVDIKLIVDEALENSPSIKNVIVVRRTGSNISMNKRRDSWWHREMEHVSPKCPSTQVDSEDALFILYTSGSTGKPKGVVHSTAGYMVYAYYSFLNVFQYEPNDIFWCTADIGWITGHSYLVYGPLLNGSTVVMFEGIPTWPDPGRLWQIINKYKVTKFYTAPTAIRSLMALGVQHLNKYNLTSLKVLGSVGEPLNEEAWEWYNKFVGRNRCPIVDTWWQTETGGIMLSTLAGVTKSKPSWVGLPLPGIEPIIVNSSGKEITKPNQQGYLCFKSSWPGIIRTTYNDHERCKQNYFSRFPNLYFSGDACKRDEEGYIKIIGRVDDVINVSGHRLGTAEIESAINEHPKIIESAVVGYPHEIKGQGICAFVISPEEIKDTNHLYEEIKTLVSRIISPIAKPDKIYLVRGLPKTRSGKIMRRILRKIAHGETDDLGDTSTLLDPSVVKSIINTVS